MRLTSKDNLLFISFSVATIATIGSLYFSEILKYEPCKLCWIQRIFMYPQAILLGVAYIRKDYLIAKYSLILSCIGGTFSLYHYGTQKIPLLGDHSLICGPTPCTAQYINWFGFITIPFLALTAFLIISIVNLILIKKQKGDQ